MRDSTELENEAPFLIEKIFCMFFGHKWNSPGIFNIRRCSRCGRREKVIYEIIVEWA